MVLSKRPIGKPSRGMALAGKTLALGLVLAGLTGACSGNKPDVPVTSTTQQGTTTAKSTTESSSLQGARKELESSVCSADGQGVWSAKGTITNTGTSKVMFQVNVAVSSKKTSTVVGKVTKTLEVAPKKSTDFSIPRVATSTDKNEQCVPFVTKVVVN